VLKKVSFVVEKLYQKNIYFDKEQAKMHVRDNAFAKYHVLDKVFKKNGYEIATCDINTIEESEVVIYMDLSKKIPLEKDMHKSFLIMNESPLVRPNNFDISKHKYFNKIFTWSDELVDDIKYFKFNYSFIIPKDIPKNFIKPGLCCMIVGNKDSKHQNELYSERKKLIKWFEANQPDDFDLYGVGWNEYRFKEIKPIRAFNRIPFLKNIMFRCFGEKHPSYKGKAVSKFKTMQDYRFAVCYENIRSISGYITEKMLDAMFAGCVPIYWGADNVIQHIPKECFIDKRDFQTYEELYQFMRGMNKTTYLKYLNEIEKFLNSDQGYKFSAESNAEIFINNIKR
jgi:alpha(1,3/1,4) fucosyltransferase